MRRFTNLSDDEIESYLSKIKRIAGMEKVDALLEVDELIYNIKSRHIQLQEDELEDEGDDIEYYVDEIKDAIKSVRRELVRLKRERQDNSLAEGEIENFKWYMSEVLDDLEDKPVGEQLLKELSEFKEECEIFIGESEIAWATRIIEGASDRDIYNVSSVKSIVKEVDYARSFLLARGVSVGHLEEIIYAAKVKCSRYRADKKLLAAEIAEKIGERQKAQKLKLEAQAMLAQDWREIFKNENFPNIAQFKQ